MKCGNWETEHYNSDLKINETTQFHFWEYINRNQTFILRSHRPFICSVIQYQTEKYTTRTPSKSIKTQK